MTSPTPTTLGPDARSVIDRELTRLSAPEHELVVLDGVHQHGAGFAAWLQLGDTPPEDPTCLLRFEQRYAGPWESIDDLIVDTVEALGWREDLDDFRARLGVPASYLMWDRDALIKHVRTTHTLITLDGLIHAFTR